MNSTTINAKQKQLANSSDLMRSFKASTSLASGLTQERVHIQHDLQKISHGKDQLEELKKMKKTKEPILTVEEKASIVNKAEIKAKGFNMTMVNSEKGKDMIEKQKDSRRQRHIEALQEAEKFVDQFYDNFMERKNEMRARVKVFFSGSDSEIAQIMDGLTDELLLSNEIPYVNGIWEKVSQHRQARKEEVQNLRKGIDNLKSFQQKGSGGYLESMRKNLINIAFILEPAVDTLIAEWIEKEQNKYTEEHLQNEKFYEEVVEEEQNKFDVLYQTWKEGVVRFHLIKQDDAIRRFLDRVNAQEFVNPQPRIDIFENLKIEQLNVFTIRMDLMKQLESTEIPNLNKEFVANIDERLKQSNDEAQIIFDKIVEDLAKDMENTNEDLDIALYDLKDFLQKNDAQLEEGTTFDTIINDRVKPTVDRRKLESKTLITNAVKYMEDFDYKMNETCQNIVNFFRDLATKLDSNKDKLKQTDINFQVALAQCGDSHDEIASAQEDELKEKIEEMRKAIHHIMLNEKLEECFVILDQITKTYRNYNFEYIKIVDSHPTTMDQFYNNFERECVQVFKMEDESKRGDLQALFQRETEVRQKKLEEIALKKYEEEKKAEELKKAEEEKSKPPAAGGKGKAPPPTTKKAGGKGEPEKPLVDVPKLEVPQIVEFNSQMNNVYLIERSLEEITDKLMDTNANNEEQQEPNKQDSQANLINNVPPPVATSQLSQVANQQQQKQPAGSKQTASQNLNIVQTNSAAPIVEPLKEEIVVPETPKFEENDYLDKANSLPPLDPYGVQCLLPNLLITKDEIISILQDTLNKALEYLYYEKINYQKKVAREGKDLTDKSVDELDENLRKQWPRKGRLEVEIYQERKSQITAHNKKYERQVRTCLEKYNLMEEQWLYLLETIESEFITHLTSQDKLRQQLPDGKNLASLQGVSRRGKDSSQTFEEKCREFEDKLYDLAATQPEILIQQNNDMLNGCQLFEKKGNYSKDEVAWYREQMKDINEMIAKCKEERVEKQQELQQKMEKLIKEPTEKFEKEYKGSILNLSAKEGLGKTFGQPRRLAQERLRGEMTKCESAQKGVDSLINKLETLIAKGKSNNLDFYSNTTNYEQEKQSLSIEIRVTLVSLIRCIIFYGQHLGGFAKEPKQLPRISYLEKQAEIELQSSETAVDAKRIEEELENLGSIGFKNVTQQQLKFPETLTLIEKQSKEMCQKLYTGENAKFLVGPEKIPEYLTHFIENMRRQSEDFRLASIRELRASAGRLVELCKILPVAIFQYLSTKYARIIIQQLDQEENEFKTAKQHDDSEKKKHLQLFRPNLENPSNKSLTLDLNTKENLRTEAYKEYIDDKQLKMLDIEQENSLEFYNAYLNNMRSLMKIYDCLLYKEDFILLPGDEIIEKKHQNIKILTAQAQKQDLSKRSTRKWPGLGPNVFDIDYASLFDHYKEFKSNYLFIYVTKFCYLEEEPEIIAPVAQQANNAASLAAAAALASANINELVNDIEIANTDHHKMIVKARNEAYNKFKTRFEQSVKSIVERFDSERKEELRFNAYWIQNLKEITQKHI